MLLPKTNIEQKLSSIKKKRILAEDIDLKQVYSILSNLDNELDRIENNVIIGNGVANNKFNIDLHCNVLLFFVLLYVFERKYHLVFNNDFR